MKGVFLDSESMGADLNREALEGALSKLISYPTTSPGQVVERIQDAEVVIVNKVMLGKDIFDACPSIKLIAVTATGTNNIDLEAAKTAGIRVCNVIRYGRPTIVQHTFSLILALSNNLLKYHADVQNGLWNKSPLFCLMDHPIQELEGKTMGIVGYGDLALQLGDSHQNQSISTSILILV
jgi:glycerate dehydrogenase